MRRLGRSAAEIVGDRRQLAGFVPRVVDRVIERCPAGFRGTDRRQVPPKVVRVCEPSGRRGLGDQPVA